jgi:hypothetical protein
MNPDDKALEARVEELTRLIRDFCHQYLTQDYVKDALMLLLTLNGHPERPLAAGDLNLWAAGIIHRSQAAVIKKGSQGPHFASDKQLAKHFGVKQIAVREKSVEISELIARLVERSFFKEIEVEERFDDENFDDAELYPEDYEVQAGEFIDEPRDRNGEYADLDIGRVFERMDEASYVKAVLQYMKQEPDYLLPYLDLADTKFAAEKGIEGKLLRDAYERALRLMGAKDGEWPRLIESLRFRNRHILLAILQQAKWQWGQGETEAARVLFQKLLEVNPLDTIGARYRLGAILEGLTLEQWNSLFKDIDLSEDQIVDVLAKGTPAPAEYWFMSIEPKYPEVFAPWREARANRMAELDLDEDTLTAEGF